MELIFFILWRKILPSFPNNDAKVTVSLLALTSGACSTSLGTGYSFSIKSILMATSMKFC